MAGLGVVFQQPTLDPDHRQQNLAYLPPRMACAAAAKQRIDAGLLRMALGERPARAVRLLNGGHRRRVEIAAPCCTARVCCCWTEATVGLDGPARRFWSSMCTGWRGKKA